MALIKCNNCGKEISDKATTCIHCGEKLNVKNNVEKPIKKASKKGILIIGGVLLAIVLVGITIFLVLNHNSKSYIGKWEHNITWKRGNKTTRTSYAYIELLKNGTFNYVGYTINDLENKITYSGTYNENNGIIYVYFKYEEQDYTGKLYINDNKLCMNGENCEDYFVKTSSKDKNSLTLNEDPTYISYSDYQNLLNNGENAIVVITMDSCSHCIEYKEILNKVVSNYSTPIYYYEVEADDIVYDTLNISGTPTTHIIKNGVNVETIEGKTEYNELSKILDKNNIE